MCTYAVCGVKGTASADAAPVKITIKKHIHKLNMVFEHNKNRFTSCYRIVYLFIISLVKDKVSTKGYTNNCTGIIT